MADVAGFPARRDASKRRGVLRGLAVVNAIEKAAKDPEYIKFANDRNTRWGYLPPAEVVPNFDKRRVAVREIMGKAGILKEAK